MEEISRACYIKLHNFESDTGFSDVVTEFCEWV